jgi:hypothetical protein
MTKTQALDITAFIVNLAARFAPAADRDPDDPRRVFITALARTLSFDTEPRLYHFKDALLAAHRRGLLRLEDSREHYIDHEHVADHEPSAERRGSAWYYFVVDPSRDV